MFMVVMFFWAPYTALLFEASIDQPLEVFFVLAPAGTNASVDVKTSNAPVP